MKNLIHWLNISIRSFGLLLGLFVLFRLLQIPKNDHCYAAVGDLTPMQFRYDKELLTGKYKDEEYLGMRGSKHDHYSKVPSIMNNYKD